MTHATETVPLDEERAQGAPRRAAPRHASAACRLVSHAALEGSFVVVTLVQMAQGWRPMQDDAVISIRSWAVLTSHTPLLGQISQATGCTGQIAYSPGPLQYWLLALPVRIAPQNGALWGAALAAIVALALSVEAGWAVRREAGALAVAACGVVLLASESVILVSPIWNPHLGAVWLVATCMTGWAVATGRLGWWPLLVLSASIAAQIHLEYTLPAVVIAILAPMAGILRERPRRWWWLPTGVALGAACWAAPLVQQITGHPGNVSVLLNCLGGSHNYGAAFGLRSLSAAVVPPPLWFAHPPSTLTSLSSASPWPGALLLVVLLAVSAVGWLKNRKDLAALSGIALVAALGAVWVVAAVPIKDGLELTYVDIILWPVGILAWVVVAWTAGELALVLWRRRVRPSPTSHSRRRRAGVGRSRLIWSATAVLLAGAVANMVDVSADAFAQSSSAAGGAANFGGAAAAARAVERAVPKGPVVVSITANNGVSSYALVYGTVWILISDGWEATAPGIFRAPIEPPAYALPGAAQASLTMRADGSVAAIQVTRPRHDQDTA